MVFFFNFIVFHNYKTIVTGEMIERRKNVTNTIREINLLVPLCQCTHYHFNNHSWRKSLGQC